MTSITNPDTVETWEQMEARGKAERREKFQADMSARILDLNALARFVHLNPELPTPHYVGSSVGPAAAIVHAYNATELAAYTRILTAGAAIGAVTKEYDKYGGQVVVGRAFGDHAAIEVWASRDKVCTSKVVGTRTVEKADPAAPKVTVEEPIIEWECKPLLNVEEAR